MHLRSDRVRRAARLVAACAGVAIVGTSPARAQVVDDQTPPGLLAGREDQPRLVVPELHRVGFVRDTGHRYMASAHSVWKPMCGSPRGSVTPLALGAMARSHALAMQAPARMVVMDRPTVPPRPGQPHGLDIVYVLGPGVPAAAVPAFQMAKAYIESTFHDPIAVRITVSFAPMGEGVVGGASCAYAMVSYANARRGLINGRDSNDTLQTMLPAGNSLPVRYRGDSTAVTRENRVFFTVANYNATIGALSGDAAQMQFSSTFPFDFNPVDGIEPGHYSLVDVIIHETTHALGFTSGVDYRVNDIEAMDIFRFQARDPQTAQYAPLSERGFLALPRLAAFNSPNERHTLDMGSDFYPMSDGAPGQAGHFREQTPRIGIMGPAIGPGKTAYPNFYTPADIAVVDALGYDR